MAAEAHEAIAEGTASLLSRSEDTDDDPFADFEEDDDELELNLNFMTSCLFRVYYFPTFYDIMYE